MTHPIEHYALIGDCHSAALVGRDGSIDWLCLPRFDSGACFAALLGDTSHGRWLIAPAQELVRTSRTYREGTLVLETTFETAEGIARLIDFMPLAPGRRDVLRIVEGVSGRVSMCMELIIRFDYGSIVPWIRTLDGVTMATAGPDTLELRAQAPVCSEDGRLLAEFSVGPGERTAFSLNYHVSWEDGPPALEPDQTLDATGQAWRQWSKGCTYQGPWSTAVMRSLIVLKALTYGPTGGMVAAPTTSLPERLGGARNWDYRYCWVRDATFTLNALLLNGYHDEAIAWREWLQRAACGPGDLRVLYSVTGERRLDEYEVNWLPGYGGAAPVRVGNAASLQFQLDVYGEVMDTLHLTRVAGLGLEPEAWRIQVTLLEFLEANWREPDEGIWEVRGPRRHFTYSKMMAWVAFDRAIKDVEAFGLEGPVERWRAVRELIHAEICSAGYDSKANTFVQSYGSSHLDASLLLMPQVGFLPAHDPRVRGTIAAIERHLVVDGLVLRYSREAHVDALPPGESTFLPCSFWLADSLILSGRRQAGEALFSKLLGLCNDVGLLSEEYDVRDHYMLGNFPQALTHMALINTACLLAAPPEQIQRASHRNDRAMSVVDEEGQANGRRTRTQSMR